MTDPTSTKSENEASGGRRSLQRTGGMLVIRAVGIVGQFLIRLMLARWLGARHFGDYVYVLSWISLLTMLAKMGVDVAAVRFVSGYVETGDWQRLRGFIQRSLLFVTMGAVVVAGLMLAMAQWGMNDDQTSLAFTLMLGAGVVCAITLGEQRASSLAGLGRVMLSQSALMVWRPILFILSVAGLYFLGIEQGTAPVAMAVMGAVACVVFLVVEIVFQRSVPADAKRVAPVYETRTWFFTSAALVGVALSGQVMARTDTIMLGLLSNTTQAGIYNIASEVAKLVDLGLVAVSAMIAPQVAAAFAAGEHDRLQKVVHQAARIATLLAIPATVVFVFVGGFVLSWFGPEYTAGRWALVVLCFGQLVHSLAGPTGLLMSMTGHERQAFTIISLAALSNIVLNAVLIPVWGIMGAAWATAIVSVVWNICVGLFCIRYLKVNPTLWPAKINRK